MVIVYAQHHYQKTLEAPTQNVEDIMKFTVKPCKLNQFQTRPSKSYSINRTGENVATKSKSNLFKGQRSLSLSRSPSLSLSLCFCFGILDYVNKIELTVSDPQVTYFPIPTSSNPVNTKTSLSVFLASYVPTGSQK